MKFLYHIRSAVMLGMILLPCLLHAQGLRIGRGASVVVQGNASLVLNDASFVNDGQFTAGGSTVLFTGDEAKLPPLISGSSRTTFNNLLICRANSQLLLESDVSLSGQLAMSAGDLELNSHRLDLGSTGIIMGEHINSRITGAKGGVVTVNVLLNAPRSVNPGNIGVELNSSANLGMVVITRGHVQQTNAAGERSIQRYYDVETAAKTSDLTLKLGYFEQELAGNSKTELVQWQLRNNVGAMNRFTLGAGTASLSVYPNPARDRVTVTYYSETDRRGIVSLQDAKGHVLERKQVRYARGLNTIQWNVSGYAAGTYYLVLEDAGLKNVQVIKQ